MSATSFGSVKFKRQGEKSGYRYSVEVTSSAAGVAGFVSSWFTWSVCVTLWTLSTFAPQLFGATAKGLVIPNHQALEVFPVPVKTDAISGHERATIIAELARSGKW